MSIDLQEIFDRTGFDAPPTRVDREVVMRKGRRIRMRRRAAVGVAATVGVGVIAAGSTALLGDGTGESPQRAAASGSSTPSPAPATKEPSSLATRTTAGSLPASAFAKVTLPDPAPGFPLRLSPDTQSVIVQMPNREGRQGKVFSVAVVPNTDGPNGPEVTMFVSNFPMPGDGATIDGHKIVETPTVAGVKGQLIRYQDQGSEVTKLYFVTGMFSVDMTGTGGATTAQMVALGDALTGLQ